MKQNPSARGCKESIHTLSTVHAVRYPRVSKWPLRKILGVVIVNTVAVFIMTCAVGVPPSHHKRTIGTRLRGHYRAGGLSSSRRLHSEIPLFRFVSVFANFPAILDVLNNRLRVELLQHSYCSI